jgi:hypothetical protein
MTTKVKEIILDYSTIGIEIIRPNKLFQLYRNEELITELTLRELREYYINTFRSEYAEYRAYL